MAQQTEARVLHDLLKKVQPAGAEHPADCPFCADDQTNPEGAVTIKTYSEDELAARIAAATAPLQEQLRQLQAGAEQAEVQSRIDAAVTAAVEPLQARVDELQRDLDAKVVEAEREKERADALQAAEDERAQEAARQAEIASKRDARIAAVAEVIQFPREHVDKRANDWAAMPDERFADQLEEYKVLAAAQGPAAPGGPPRASALTASAGPDPRLKAGGTGTGTGAGVSALRVARDLRTSRRSVLVDD